MANYGLQITECVCHKTYQRKLRKSHTIFQQPNDSLDIHFKALTGATTGANSIYIASIALRCVIIQKIML